MKDGYDTHLKTPDCIHVLPSIHLAIDGREPLGEVSAYVARYRRRCFLFDGHG
jgi:hypothetical protein